MSTPSTTLLHSPSSGKTSRVAVGEASPARSNKMGSESSAQFADLMKNYGNAQLKPHAPESIKQPQAAEPAAKPLNPAGPKIPAEGKTELQRQEERLSMKKQAHANEPKLRSSSPSQAPKGPQSQAVKAEAEKPAKKPVEEASNSATSDSVEKTEDKQADAGQSSDLAGPQQASIELSARAAADPTRAENARRESLSSGEILATQVAAHSDSASASLFEGADAGNDAASKPILDLAASSQARPANLTRRGDSAADLPPRLASTRNADESSANSGHHLGNDVRTILNGTSSFNSEAGASQVQGASFESMLAAAGIAAPSSPEVKSSSAAPTQLSFSQAITEPSFAPEMAARLSVLAADGVQEARLHLNPAEMGPVSVQIIVDGQQAQVSFHAEHEGTRSVLEQSLPDLAAALRESGLTLSGGGVFQQPREHEKSAHNDSTEGGRKRSDKNTASSMSPAMAATPPTARQPRGVVDLYA